MKYLILSFLVFSSMAYGQTCKEKILLNYGDSRHMTIFASHVLSNPNERMDEQMALNAANYMNQEFNCSTTLNKENAQVQCTQQLLKNHAVCNIKVKYGFYYVFKDYVDTVHIVFSRWD